MPTNANAYNSRLTDEALEKRFRDTFRSQGGAELVDDLYASGVIVPVVDFTQAAEGSQLPQNLQTAWDFSTGFTDVADSTETVINTAGFWQFDATINNSSSAGGSAIVRLTDGLTTRTIWSAFLNAGTSISLTDNPFVVFVRANDEVTVSSSIAGLNFRVWYRQIATVNGDLNNPTGFVSS